MSNLRDLARHCASCRAGRTLEDPIVFYSNAIITIVARIFGQRDLLPNNLMSMVVCGVGVDVGGTGDYGAGPSPDSDLALAPETPIP